MRIQNDSRCALLNRILLYFLFFLRLPSNVIGGSLYPFRIFCSVFFCQTVKPGACTVARSIANTKEHHRKFAYQCVLSTFVASPFWCRFFFLSLGRIKHVRVTLKHLNGNLRLPFVSTSTPRACLLVPARWAVVFGLSQASILKLNALPF